MRLLFFLAWKSWASSPLRVCLSLLGVGLGVAIVTAIHVVDHNTILSQIERTRWDYGRVDFELRPLGSDVDLEARLDELARRDEIADVGIFANAPVQLRVGEARQLVSLDGQTPVGGERFGHWRVARGEDLGELDEAGRVLVSPTLADALSLEIGSQIELRALPRASVARCVGGERAQRGGDTSETVKSRTLVVQGILEPFRLARRDGGLVVIGRLDLVRELANYFQPVFQVRRAAGADPDALATSFRDGWSRVKERAAMFGENADEAAFRNGVKILGCLALVLGMFVIFHTLAHSLAEKVRSVGILRALGATQVQVTSVFLIDAFVLACLGTALGLLGGIGLAKILAEQKITTLGLGKAMTTFELPLQSLVAISMLGIVVTMLGAAFPLAKLRNMSPRRILYVRDLAPPADLMRGVNVFLLVLLVGALPLAYLAMTPLLSDAGRGAGFVLLQVVAIVAVFFAILLLSPRLVRRCSALPLRLARSFAPLGSWLVERQLVRAPGRIATSVCGITLVGLAITGLGGLTTALVAEVDAFAEVALQDRIFLKTKDALPEARWAEIDAVDGVEAVLPLSAVVAMPFRCIGTEVAALTARGDVLEGQGELVQRMQKTRGIVVSKRLARLRDLRVGSKIPVRTDAGGVVYEVVAVSDESGFYPDERAWALCDRRHLRHDFCLETKKANRFAVRVRPGVDHASVIQELRQVVPTLAWIKSGDDVRTAHRADVGRDFRFFDILLCLLLVFAGVGQLNLLTLSTIARSREIGVLRALGMTRSDWLVTLLVEAFVVGFLTALMTVAAGIALLFVLLHGVSIVSGLEVPIVVPWAVLAGVVGLGFVVSFAAALVPSMRATAIAPAKALRGS